LVSADEIERLEVSRGMKSNWKTGSWVGTLGGVPSGCWPALPLARTRCSARKGALRCRRPPACWSAYQSVRS
jgi:hypothetical protein